MKRIVNFLLALAILAGVTACSGPAGTQSEPQKPTWQEQYDLGVRYLSEGNYEEAIIAFTAAIEIDPKQAPAYVGRGDAYVQSGETEENLTAAQADYEKAIELDESSADAYLGLADVYIRQGYYDKAIKILQQGLEGAERDQSILDKIAEIEGGNISDTSGHLRKKSVYGADGDMVYYHIYGYDSRGRQSSVTSYDASDNLTGHIDLVYDQNNNKIVDYTTAKGTGELWQDEYEYDAYGNIVRGCRSKPGEPPTHYWINTFDENNNCVQTTDYDMSGKMMDFYTYEYDAANRLIRHDTYSSDGTRTEYFINNYDESNKVFRRDFYGEDNNLKYYNIYFYNSDGALVMTEEYNPNGDIIQTENYK